MKWIMGSFQLHATGSLTEFVITKLMDKNYQNYQEIAKSIIFQCNNQYIQWYWNDYNNGYTI